MANTFLGLIFEIAVVSNFKQKVPLFGKYLAMPLVPLEQVCITTGYLRLSFGGYETLPNCTPTSNLFTAEWRGRCSRSHYEFGRSSE